MKKHFLLKVKEGKLEQWKHWCVYLLSQKEIAKETLKRENAVAETGVLFTLEGEHYVYGMTEYFDTPIKADMTMELNQKHIANVKECLEIVSKGEELFDIRRD